MRLINKKGFTLLEMIVAMAILSVIVVAIYTSFRGGTDSWTKGRAMSEMNQNARIILELMTREISSAIISPHTDLDDTTDSQDLVFVGDSDSLDFTAVLRSPDSSEKYQFGLVEIGYSLSSNVLRRRLDTTAIWDSAGSADTNPLAGDSPDDLAYNVTQLNFEYWDGAGFNSNWDTRLDTEGSTTAGSIYDENKLPSAVKITISVTDSKGIINPPKEYSTIVYLPRAEVF